MGLIKHFAQHPVYDIRCFFLSLVELYMIEVHRRPEGADGYRDRSKQFPARVLFREYGVVRVAKVQGQYGRPGLVCDKTRPVVDLHQVPGSRDTPFGEDQEGCPAIHLFYHSFERIGVQRIDLHGVPVLHEGPEE